VRGAMVGGRLLRPRVEVVSTSCRRCAVGEGRRDDAAERLAPGRLEMPGYVSDEASIAHFHDCLAVLYAPFDEDYGYVTLEAFLAGKPVVTTADAGGVLEWVEDGVTGLVTDGTPEGLGEAFDRLDADRELAAQMGRAGRARAEALGWDHVVATLLAAADR